MSDIYTLSTWHVREGQEEAFLTAFTAMTDAATALGGAREGVVLASADEPGLYAVLRRWDDEAALDRWGAERDPALVDAVLATVDAERAVSHVLTKVADLP